MQFDEAGLSLGDIAAQDRAGSQTRDADASIRGLTSDAQQPSGIDKFTGPPRRRGPLRLSPLDKSIAAPSCGGRKRKRPIALAEASTDMSQPIDRFLRALARTGNPSLACQASLLTRREVNVLREQDAHFARAFDEAMDEAADMLEAEAWRRALEGVAEPVFKGGKPVCDPVTGQTLMVRRYSDALLMLLLRSSKPGKFARRPEAISAREDLGQIIREIAADHDPPRREAKPVRPGRP